MDRNETIATIKAALKARSGHAWSVTGGTGTSWGWIRIDVLPAERKFNIDGSAGGGNMSPARRVELADLLGLESVHFQGVGIPDASDYYAEYVARAKGEKPAVLGQRYWD